MTKKETRDAIRIMQAYVDGKTIEHKTSSEGHYEHVDYPAWNFSHDPQSYRVRPEPHYRPFESAEEVMEAIKEHGGYVKDDNTYYHINRFTVYEYGIIIYSFGELMGDWEAIHDKIVWADGTPFGKLEEE